MAAYSSMSNVPVEIPEIDKCVICLKSELSHNNDSQRLSVRLESRLKWVEGPLPDIEMVDVSQIPREKNQRNEQPSTSRNNGNGIRSNLNIYGNLNANISAQLRSMFVLKHVFKHPVNHPTTEKMMLLVDESPSDWFTICSSCTSIVNEGIQIIKNLQNMNIEWNKRALEAEFGRKVRELQQKFVTSYTIPAGSWEPELGWESWVCMPNYFGNFLLTETQAVLEFRQFIHRTAITRLQQIINAAPLPMEMPVAQQEMLGLSQLGTENPNNDTQMETLEMQQQQFLENVPFREKIDTVGFGIATNEPDMFEELGGRFQEMKVGEEPASFGIAEGNANADEFAELYPVDDTLFDNLAENSSQQM